MITLRPYQAEILQGVYRSMSAGHRRPLVASACGSGKTVIFGELARLTQLKGNSVVVLVHRRELLKQTNDMFRSAGIDKDLISVHMAQTYSRRLEQMPRPDLIITDECFPAGTRVDGKPIESILPGDHVNSFNHQMNRIEKKKVIGISKKTVTGNIFRFNGDFACTDNHPIWVVERNRYVEAKNIRQGEHLLLHLQEEFAMDGSPQIQEGSVGEQKTNLLFGGVREEVSPNSSCGHAQKHRLQKSEREDAQEQPDERSHCSQKNDPNTDRYWSPTNYQGRQRSRTDATAEVISKGIKRTCARDGICSCDRTEKEQSGQIPTALQNRHCITRPQISDRDRWTQSCTVGASSTRSQKEQLLKAVRVESIEIFQRGSHDEFERLCSDGYVYNLEVEGNNNYFAENCLVHNCHLAAANTWQRIFDHWSDAYVVGFSATPARLDGKPLGAIFDDLILGPTPRELIDAGWLADYRYFSVTVADIAKLRRKGMDFDQDQASELLSERAVYGDVIDTFRRLADGKRTVVYCTTVEHSIKTAAEFNRAGYVAEHIDGKTPDKKRDAIIKRFRTGKTQILTNCQIVDVGFDLPAIEACVMLRPTMSTAMYVQQSGRALRPMEGKTALILDFVGNHIRHGLPDDDRDWRLDTRLPVRTNAADDGSFLIRHCTECFAVYPSTLRNCPECGHEYTSTREEIKQIEEARLVEIRRRSEQRLERWKETRSEHIESEEDCKTYADLCLLGKKMGVSNVRKWATAASYRLDIPRPWERKRA